MIYFLLLVMCIFLISGWTHHFYLSTRNLLPVVPSIWVSYLIHGGILIISFGLLHFVLKMSIQLPLLIYFGILILKIVLYFMYFKPRFLMDNEIFDWEKWTFFTPLFIAISLFIGGLHLFGAKSL